MATRRFTHRPSQDDLAGRVPPGQHLVDDFPVFFSWADTANYVG